MLCLHIGMPKTGTTALQAHLRAHEGALSEAGLHYMRAGRERPGTGGKTLISHNQIVFDLKRGHDTVAKMGADIAAEYAAHAGKTCVISSEMLYSVPPEAMAALLAGVPADEVTIAFFCRSYDSFVEADYKQRAKNGRIAGGATGFVTGRLEAVRAEAARFGFGARVSALRRAFPRAAISPMLYDRARLRNGNVVDEFIATVGAGAPEGAAPEGSNQSLSRVGSEAFGIVSRALDRKQSRRLRRIVPEEPVMLRRNDVLEPAERLELSELMNAVDAGFRDEFFPDRDILFPPASLTDEEKTFRRDDPKEAEDFAEACEIVFRLALQHLAG